MKNEKIEFFLQLFKLLPKLSDFINSDDCIGKIASKYITLCPVFILKRFISDDKRDYSSEKYEKFR